MPQAKGGDFVHVHYTGRLDDDSVFDTSQDRDPLNFQLGVGQVVPGFDRAVSGMAEGEKKTVTIPASDAYGPRIDQLVFTAPRENLPPGYDPKVGEMVGLETRDGHQIDVVVIHADEKVVRMDGNHPLAGKDLTFEIELVKIG
jgi:peptidylprolyl isomerase